MRTTHVFVAAGLFAAAGTAQAGFTTIGAPASGELGHGDIFAGVFGGAWSASGLNYGNGTYTATRLNDYIGTTLSDTGAKLRLDSSNVAGATPTDGSETVTDAVWQDGTRLLSARAVYSGASQRLDWRNNNTALEGNLISNIAAQASILTGPTMTTALNSSDFEFIRDGDHAYNTGKFYSNQNSNGTALSSGSSHDFMVTYHLTGPGFDGFMLFFEDREAANGGDGDFNDLAILIVPLPPAAWAGLSTLAGAAGVAALRRRRLRGA